MQTVCWLVVCIAVAMLVVACKPSTSSETSLSDRNLDQTTLKPIVEIRSPYLANFLMQLKPISLPYNTQKDPIAITTSPLADKDFKLLFKSNSLFKEVTQCYPIGKLPDYGNFAAVIFAEMKQGTGELRLLLVTYSPEGQPLDELLLKDNYGTERELIPVYTLIYKDWSIEQVWQTITDAPDQKNVEVRQQVRRYDITSEGKIKWL